jgi:hypothetical protein
MLASVSTKSNCFGEIKMKRPRIPYGQRPVTGTQLFTQQSSQESTFRRLGKLFLDNTFAGFGVTFLIMSPVWAQIIVNLAFPGHNW